MQVTWCDVEKACPLVEKLMIKGIVTVPNPPPPALGLIIAFSFVPPWTLPTKGKPIYPATIY